MALLSGKTGYVLIGGIPYRFGKWDLPMTAGVPKAFNFVDAPYEVYVSGLIGAKLTADGPYDAGNMGMIVSNTYVFSLGWTNTLFVGVTSTVSTRPTMSKTTRSSKSAPRSQDRSMLMCCKRSAIPLFSKGLFAPCPRSRNSPETPPLPTRLTTRTAAARFSRPTGCV